MITSYIFALTVFILYITLCLKKFGITNSISATYYKWKEIKEDYGIFFTLFCFGVSLPLMIVLINYGNPYYQFLGFLAAGGLALVGVASNYMEAPADKVHTIAAIACGSLAILWQCLEGFWVLPVFCSIGATILWVNNKDKVVYLFEMAAFVSTFMTIFCLMIDKL